MTHPTPAELRLAVHDVLMADAKTTQDDPNVRPIPVRVWGLIDKAFSRECDRAERRNS